MAPLRRPGGFAGPSCRSTSFRPSVKLSWQPAIPRHDRNGGAVIATARRDVLHHPFLQPRQPLHLLVGLAFFVNGMKDSVHGLLALADCRHWITLSESRFEQAIPATGVSGRILMGVLLISAVLLPSRTRTTSNRKAKRSGRLRLP